MLNIVDVLWNMFLVKLSYQSNFDCANFPRITRLCWHHRESNPVHLRERREFKPQHYALRLLLVPLCFDHKKRTQFTAQDSLDKQLQAFPGKIQIKRRRKMMMLEVPLQQLLHRHSFDLNEFIGNICISHSNIYIRAMNIVKAT